VVDLRDRVAFAAGYLPGAFSFPLDGNFASYVGWMIPWGTPLTLLGESPEQVAQAQRELVRIGIDRPAAAATGRPEAWAGERGTASLRLVKFGDLATALADGSGHRPVVLDVRRRLEWEESHIAGAVHIPLHELPGRLDELPEWPHAPIGRPDAPTERPDAPTERPDAPTERPDARTERPDALPGSPAEPPGRRAELPSGEVWVHCGAGYRSMVAASMLAARGRRVVAVDDDFANAEAAGLSLERA
jgi:rhodanese-related sulfurtransferase